jgi:hypothetical protein
MSVKDLTRARIAHELRRKAERYRSLACGVNDERALEIIQTMSRELDEKAAQIEREVLERTPSRKDRAA